MKQFIVDLFKLEKKPVKGLMTYEWAVMAYLVLTLIVILSMYTIINNSRAMIFGRLRIVVLMAAMWVVYRLAPCRATHFLHVDVQLGLPAWWYPDAFEINRRLSGLDHLFAQWEQDLLGYQPALLFSKALPGYLLSELFDMGYAAYYSVITAMAVYHFEWYYKEFSRAAFVILSSFFIYYTTFIFVPTTGPIFYYKVIGLQNMAAGTFPNAHDYFNHHQECLSSPGCVDGIFYHLAEDTEVAGERLTTTFPSSHVDVSTVCMSLLRHDRSYGLLAILTPFYLLLCCATVYIQAHYLIDAIAGFTVAIILFTILLRILRRMITA